MTTGGPLTDHGTPGTLCAPAPVGGVLSDGLEALSNTGETTAVVHKVSLAEPHGLRVVAAYLVPITGHVLYGIWSGTPPAAHLSAGVRWGHRQHADGGRIPHSQGRHVMNLLIVIKPARQGGRAAGIYVDYTVDGHQYRMETTTGVHVVVGHGCPS